MEAILIKTLQFFASLSLLVLIHEFGHYITARMFKIRVEQFYIFFNPWFSIYKRKIGDTVYGIGWLPLGGYVSLAGMIDETTDKEKMELLNQPPQPWEFRSKPAWKRLIVMLAGVVMNVLLAMAIYSGILYTWGDTYYHNDDMVNGYVFNEAGEKLGFADGDRIVAIDGEKIEDIGRIGEMLLLADSNREVEIIRDGETMMLNITLADLVGMRENEGFKGLYMEFIPFVVEEVTTDSAKEAGIVEGDRIVAINATPTPHLYEAYNVLDGIRGTVAELSIMRNGEMISIEAPISEEGAIGIAVNRVVPRHKEYGFWESIPAGIKLAGSQIASYWEQLTMIVNPETKMYKELGGFIAIGNIFPDKWNWQGFWNITALLSIVLAVMNILPIPGLDGGHALFTLWEIITGRKPSDKFMSIVQGIGMVLLFALLIYANGSDIIRLFK